METLTFFRIEGSDGNGLWHSRCLLDMLDDEFSNIMRQHRYFDSYGMIKEFEDCYNSNSVKEWYFGYIDFNTFCNLIPSDFEKHLKEIGYKILMITCTDFVVSQCGQVIYRKESITDIEEF